jgi:hypothetical protein
VGSSQDPYILSNEIVLSVEDNPVFDLTLTGQGTLEAPWRLSVNYRDTATLDDIPNVDTSARQNGYSLTWDAANSRWIASQVSGGGGGGTLLVDNSLTGDGSAGAPLQVRENAARYLETTTAGLGLNDAGVQRIIRKFTTATARNAATPAPVLNTLSMLDDAPGRIDYWTGTAWAPLVTAGNLAVANGAQFMSLSGAYAGGPVTTLVKQISLTTAADGTFTAVSAAELTGRAGVLECSIIPVQPSGAAQVWLPMVSSGTTFVRGTAWNVAGTVRGNTAIQATVRALLY